MLKQGLKANLDAMSEEGAQQLAEFKVCDSARKRSENIQATSLNDLIMRGKVHAPNPRALSVAVLFCPFYVAKAPFTHPRAHIVNLSQWVTGMEAGGDAAVARGGGCQFAFCATLTCF